MRLIHGEEVFGVSVDAQTRCAHWNSPVDVIALRFFCCRRWYPCYQCHLEVADHRAIPVPVALRDEPEAVLCGVCGHKMSVNEYFGCGAQCPTCKAKFNPGCANHYHLYFE
ncbi:MAG: hypothetical protein C4324_12005 [Blastocatellia bacterium]